MRRAATNKHSFHPGDSYFPKSLYGLHINLEPVCELVWPILLQTATVGAALPGDRARHHLRLLVARLCVLKPKHNEMFIAPILASQFLVFVAVSLLSSLFALIKNKFLFPALVSRWQEVRTAVRVCIRDSMSCWELHDRELHDINSSKLFQIYIQKTITCLDGLFENTISAGTTRTWK